jgi:hypothetical protein
MSVPNGPCRRRRASAIGGPLGEKGRDAAARCSGYGKDTRTGADQSLCNP